MPEHQFLIEFAFSDMGSQILPSVQRNTIIAGGFNQENLIRARLKLQDHSHVVEVRAREGPCDFRPSLTASEQQNVAGIRDFQELRLTHVVKPPKFADARGRLVLPDPLAAFDVESNDSLPMLTFFLVFCLESEHPVGAFNIELKNNIVGRRYLRLIEIKI